MPLGQDYCPQCGQRIVRDGVADFVGPEHHSEEASFYNAAYAEGQSGALSADALRAHWQDPDAPQNELILNALGSISGQHVLLIGNGASDKELYLLNELPATLIYSDLSSKALDRLKHPGLAEQSDRLKLAAIDAMRLPMLANSLDLIYGYAMVHHLPDTAGFIREVCRVLKPGGRAVFYDDAYSPVWHSLKTGLLGRLRQVSHTKTGISPEDLRFSETGGFKEAELEAIIHAAGGQAWFRRCSFFQYLLHRGAGKLLPNRISRQLRHGRLAIALNRLDRWAARHSQRFQANQVRLVWGFDKPDPSSKRGH
ncbi:MAG: methyltransferase domain-containing protein [Burkholderiaceae bacterium]